MIPDLMGSAVEGRPIIMQHPVCLYDLKIIFQTHLIALMYSSHVQCVTDIQLSNKDKKQAQRRAAKETALAVLLVFFNFTKLERTLMSQKMIIIHYNCVYLWYM